MHEENFRCDWKRRKPSNDICHIETEVLKCK